MDYPNLVRRGEYLKEVESLIGAGFRVINIWGEPGTGKSTLAKQVAQVLAGSPTPLLRTNNADLLADDLVQALIAEGQEPAAWSPSYCSAILRQVLSGSPYSAAFIVDGIEDEDKLWQLIPLNPTIPVLVTSEHKLQSEQIAHVELHDFTEAEALHFVRSRLGSYDEEDARALVDVLGFRPLALEHALLYMREAADVNLNELINNLTRGVAGGLGLVTLPSAEAKNLVALYQGILTSIANYEPAREVLDYFLALSGRTATFSRELLYDFMKHVNRPGTDRVRFRAGLRTLAHYGLLREEEFHFESGFTQSAVWSWLTMHQLTGAILRELRGTALLDIESDYFDFLINTEVEYDDDPRSGQNWVWTYNHELKVTANLLEDWQYVHAIDEKTWLTRRIENGSSYLARYEVFPHGVYKFDHRTGLRAPMELPEGRELYRLMKLYGAAVHADMLRRAADDQAREIVGGMDTASVARILHWMWKPMLTEERERPEELLRVFRSMPFERRVEVLVYVEEILAVPELARLLHTHLD